MRRHRAAHRTRAAPVVGDFPFAFSTSLIENWRKATRRQQASEKAYTLSYSASAEKALGRIQAKVAERIVSALEAIAADPFGHHPAARALTGSKDTFRLRVGEWRALYRIEREAKRMIVADVLKREEAYR